VKIRVGMHAKSDSPRSAGSRPELICLDERFSRPADRSGRGLVQGETFRTMQNRRNNAQEASTLIGGLKPGVELEIHLRGNPIFVGANCHILKFF
jgi:hypothetical protein